MEESFTTRDREISIRDLSEICFCNCILCIYIEIYLHDRSIRPSRIEDLKTTTTLNCAPKHDVVI